MARQALGKGISALIPQGQSRGRSRETNRATPESQDKSAPSRDKTNHNQKQKNYFECDIERIDPQSNQPRSHFDGAALNELAQSIREHGILQPLIVERIKTKQATALDRFCLVAGERRWRAAQLAGLSQVPVVVRDIESKLKFELALLENIQREDLTPIEEANSYQHLIDEYNYSKQHLADRIGKNRSTISNAIRLLKLPKKAQDALTEKKISSGHARALLGLPHKALMTQALNDVMTRSLSVRDTEKLVRHLSAAQSGAASKADKNTEPPNKKNNANVRDLETRLSQSLGSKVAIKHKANNAGTITVHYSSLDSLDSLISRLER